MGNCPEMPETTKCGQCRLRLTPEYTNKLTGNIIAYFVTELLMSIGVPNSH